LATKDCVLHYEKAPSQTTYFCTREFLTKNNMTVFPHSSYFSLYPRLKIKLKGRHIDKIEAIEAESQMVLYNLTEHDFQDAFKKGRIAGNGAYAREGKSSRVMAAAVPEIVDGSWYFS
jgi:hypothetical protein